MKNLDDEVLEQVKKIPGLEEYLQKLDRREDMAVFDLQTVEIDSEHVLAVYILNTANVRYDGTTNFTVSVVATHNDTRELRNLYYSKMDRALNSYNPLDRSKAVFNARTTYGGIEYISDQIDYKVYSKGILDKKGRYIEMENHPEEWVKLKIEGEKGEYTITVYGEDPKQNASFNYSIRESVEKQIKIRTGMEAGWGRGLM